MSFAFVIWDVIRHCHVSLPMSVKKLLAMDSLDNIITLAISKCYGKVRVLFFPRDNSLISRGNSHVSRIRGLVGLVFNPEVSCSNLWVCANFFYKYSEAEGSDFFRH